MEKAFPSLWLSDRYLRDFPKSLHMKIIGVKGGIESWPPRKQLWKHFLSLTLQPSWFRAIGKISKQKINRAYLPLTSQAPPTSSCSPFLPLHLCISADHCVVWPQGTGMAGWGLFSQPGAQQGVWAPAETQLLTFLLRSFGKLVALCLSFLSVKGNNALILEYCYEYQIKGALHGPQCPSWPRLSQLLNSDCRREGVPADRLEMSWSLRGLEIQGRGLIMLPETAVGEDSGRPLKASLGDAGKMHT